MQIIDLKDQLDIIRLERSIQKSSVWRFWDPMAKKTLRPKPSEIQNRKPHDDKVHRLVKQAKAKSMRIGLGQFLLFCFFILSIQQLYMTVNDYPKIQAYRALEQKDISVRSPEEIKPVINWLERYALNNQPHWRHSSYFLFLNRKKASEAYTKLSQERDDKIWERVKSSEPNSKEERIAIQNYLKKVSDGKYQVQAKQLLIRNSLINQISSIRSLIQSEIDNINKLQSDSTKSSTFWNSVHTKIKLIKIPKNPEEFDLEKPVFSDLISSLDTLRQLKKVLLEKINSAGLTSLCQERSKKMDINLANGDLASAADYFEVMQQECSDLKITPSKFLARIERSFKQFVNSRLSDGNLLDLYKKLNAAGQSRILLELDAQNKTNLLGRINQVLSYAGLISERNLFGEIRSLWNGWDPLTDKKTPTRLDEKFKLYQQIFSSGKMNSEILKADKEFQNIISNITVEIQLVELYLCALKGWPYRFSAKFGDKDFFDGFNITRGCHTYSWQNNTIELTAHQLTESYPFKSDVERVIDPNYWAASWYHKQQASYSEYLTLAMLRGGHTITLRSKGFRNSPRVTLKLTSWPQVNFKLPQWDIVIEKPSWLDDNS